MSDNQAVPKDNPKYRSLMRVLRVTSWIAIGTTVIATAQFLASAPLGEMLGEVPLGVAMLCLIVPTLLPVWLVTILFTATSYFRWPVRRPTPEGTALTVELLKFACIIGSAIFVVPILLRT